MDCSICSTTLPLILRPPRNTICAACYEGAKSVIAIMGKLENDQTIDHKFNSSSANLPLNSFNKPLANVPRWMNGMKDAKEELNEKISFLNGFVSLFREQILTDIHLKAGDDGSPIPAHKALLAARSEIFKNMLDSDTCKAPANDVVVLPELNHEELESLLKFLYSGTLCIEKMEKHVYALTLAADKYEIPYLIKCCEKHMLRSLDSTNVLDVLEISDVCSNKMLKETALNFIVRNVEDVVFSPKFEGFVCKSPHLGVQITRAFLMDAKCRKVM